MSNDREKALEMALAQIDKQYGKGSIMRMGDKTDMAIEAIPTGALALDVALGIGGLPRGRVVEIYGPESSGKSTLAMHVVAEAQRQGGVAAFVVAAFVILFCRWCTLVEIAFNGVFYLQNVTSKRIHRPCVCVR